MPTSLQVRIPATRYAFLLVGMLGALVSLPVLLAIGMLLFDRTARDLGAALGVAAGAVPVLWLLARTLRPIVVTLDAGADRIRVRTPRVFWRARVYEVPAAQVARLEVREVGELRRGNGPGVPTWSLLLVHRDGNELALWRQVVAPSRPWSEPAARVTQWCEARHTGAAQKG